jgi:hypothetical protein
MPDRIDTADGQDGALMLQGHGNPVELRKIRTKPLG